MRHNTPAVSRMPLAPKSVTAHLSDLKKGQTEADAELMAVIYAELRRIAGAHFRHERPDHTMQPTELVSEAYLRLMKPGRVPWKNRTHFLAIASKVMRRVLIEKARARAAKKRGAGQPELELSEDAGFDPPQRMDILALHEALNRLARFDRKKSRVVELRFFGGLTIEETAEELGIGLTTAKGHWAVAKAWLKRELNTHDTAPMEQDRAHLPKSDPPGAHEKKWLPRQGVRRR